MRSFWKTISLASLLALPFSQPADAGVIAFGSGGNTFNMEFVAIGDAGNADDTTGAPNPAGSVAYAYNMGKYEVSEDMISKYNLNYGNANSLVITTSNRGVDKPATNVSWNEAARFTNWLNTSSGYAAAYKFDVNGDSQVWTSGDAGYAALNPYRNSLANYVLPSMDEWYKAAYYNPTTSSYFDYATGSNSAPVAVASGDGTGLNGNNEAVYDGQTGPADVNLAGGLSPYGIMGLGGNVFEWEETSSDLNNSSVSSHRGIRGGNWDDSSFSLSSSSRNGSNPAGGNGLVGFRVASLSSSAAAVPEPGSFAVLTLLGITGAAYRKRKRK